MRIVVAPQEYKGTLTAREAAAAIATGIRRAAPDAGIDVIPLSDGGSGFHAVLGAAGNGELRSETVRDPLGRPIVVSWALLPNGVAVVDVAAAAGLILLTESECDPRITSTRGLGELIYAALSDGARRLIVGVGGSATNDGGAGMAAALGARFFDATGRDLPPGGAALAHLDRIDITGLDPRLAEATVIAATDVTNPLCGPKGASLVYGPQKGASPTVARELDAALHQYGEVIERDLGVPVLAVSGAGAAGGLGAGLIAFLKAEVRSGFDVVAESVHLRDRLTGADLVITGEGRLDAQTAYGKTVARVAALASDLGVPAVIVPGTLGEGWEEMARLVVHVEPAADGDPATALSNAAELAVRRWLSARP